MTSSVFWPGTGVARSTGNAFDWRGRPSALADSDRAYYHPPRADKTLRGPKAFGNAAGGTIVGLSDKSDRRLMEIQPRPLVHVSRAKKGGA